MPTRLCVPIFVTDEAQARRDIALAAERGADIVELRVDTFDGDQSKLVDHSVVPAIVTRRPTWEGGHSTESDQDRFDRLTVGASLAAYTDVELETYRRLRFDRALIPRLILSAHDFTGRPNRLANLVQELIDSPADVIKIVWTARSIRDNLEAFEILQTRGKPTIALCMGEAGLVSRVLAKKFNAFLTFASLDDTSATAPGQVSIADIKQLYRWDAITPATRVFGVVGSPVAHSMSPAVHNAAFDQTGFDGVYLPLLVNPGYESFKAFVETFVPFKGLDLTGLSVTIPHKENALRYIKEKGGTVEPLAEAIGAVNTIAIRDGRLSGSNTDHAAILDSITATGTTLAGKRAAVLGAGGTARAAVAGLVDAGATVVVHNRTPERADALAACFTRGVTSAPWESIGDGTYGLIVNTTRVGMSPDVDQSPVVDPSIFKPGMVVFDAVYNPVETKLLRQAKSADATVVGGVEMFVRQAAAQFRLWTGVDAPVDVMRRIVLDRIG